MPSINRPDGELLNGSPFGQYQYVDVVFSSTPNADTVVRHSLDVVSPENINYIPVKLNAAGVVYNDQSATRKLWGQGFIVLRASVASLKAKLLLTVERNP